jgi:branched-subunit amino acid ABC-type transport system permease component
MTGFFWTSDWAPALSIVLLLAILIVFPHGLLRRSGT